MENDHATAHGAPAAMRETTPVGASAKAGGDAATALKLPDSGLKIITGKGKHSKDNVAVIKPQMKTMLASADFAGLGAIEDARNSGMLVVRAESLRAWIAARDIIKALQLGST